MSEAACYYAPWLGHVVLGHTDGESMTDAAELPRCIKELEAESVAMLVLDALGDSERGILPGLYSALAQVWGVSSVPEASAKRIFAAYRQDTQKAGLGELQEAVAA